MIRLLADLAPSDPATGLGLEEALLESVRKGGEDSLRIWVNRRAVVIGRSQGAASEVDLERARALGIPLLRRLSGGGTVYHYPGNLNVSLFLADGRPLGGVEETFARLGEAFSRGLAALCPAVSPAWNSLFIGKRKVGGGAQARRGASLLYHTTLLLKPDAIPMEELLLALRPGYRPRGVASHPHPVTTLAEAGEKELDSEEVGRAMAAAAAELLGKPLRESEPTAAERARAATLAEEKYGRASWNLSR